MQYIVDIINQFHPYDAKPLGACAFAQTRGLAHILYGTGPRVKPHIPSSGSLVAPSGGENLNLCTSEVMKMKSSFKAISFPRQWRRPANYKHADLNHVSTFLSITETVLHI